MVDNRIEELLSRCCEANEEDAKPAFCELDKCYRPILIRRLLRTGTPFADAEDAAQHSFNGFWMSRTTFRNEGAVKWRRFLFLSASRFVIDRRRAEANHPSILFDDHAVPPDEQPILDSLAAAALKQRLYACANQVFLELDPKLSHDEHDRQLISAQLYYEDGESIQNILEVMQCSPVNGTPIGMQTLRGWLQNAAVIQYLAYQSLYFENAPLTAAMLCTDRVIDTDPLNELSRDILTHDPQAPAICDVTWLEAGVAIWHYRQGMSASQIVKLIEDAVDANDATAEWKKCIHQVEPLLQALGRRLPFKRRILRLIGRVMERSNIDLRIHLKRNNIWQRLAFQYYYHDDIGPTAILERIDPAAQAVPVFISAETLTMWTSGKRLQNAVLKYWRKVYEGDFDD